MDIHEYQAKEILSNYDVQILEGKLAVKTSEAVDAFNNIDSDICVVKAQVHSGARGKLVELYFVNLKKKLKLPQINCWEHI